MFQLNFFSAFTMVSGFLPLFKKQQSGTFLFVGARPALQLQDATSTVAYSLSKKLVISLSEIVAEEVKGTDIRTHVFVPSIIDTTVIGKRCRIRIFPNGSILPILPRLCTMQ
jgi:short-subunit dehydrogenase